MTIPWNNFSKVFYFNETGHMFGQIDNIKHLIYIFYLLLNHFTRIRGIMFLCQSKSLLECLFGLCSKVRTFDLKIC